MRTIDHEGRIDGMVDAINKNSCDPFGRFSRWHRTRPDEDWPAYRDSYVAAFIDMTAELRAVEAL